DDAQSIYRFRGADIGVLNEARRVLCGVGGEPLELTWNFRSEPRLVAFVNRVGERALGETARALAPECPSSVVEYQTLRGARPATPAAGLEWLAVDGPSRAAERREEGAKRIASRIRELVGRVPVVDPDTGETRRAAARDIAILARRNDDLAVIEPALRSQGVRHYNAATGGLADRQEALDLVTLLRVAENPLDDLQAFAYLRSPFVGLRDEVLARIVLDGRAGGGSLLRRAGAFLEGARAGAIDWFDPPEGPLVSEIEGEALRIGLEAVREARAVADRVAPAELLESAMQRTGYRLHLLFRDDASEALANVERFLALVEEYRHLPLRRFLALWDRWGKEDLGIPQARLFSSGDDVVTLSTIHGAKGLEWPIVFLFGTDGARVNTRFLSGAYWSDPALGP
ncbi:MAG: UvrD-helicase domain-containing protein, partial [Gemmatimonadota bacterium]